MSPAQIRDARAELEMIGETLAKIDPEALLVLRLVAGRLLEGHERYGALDIAHDPRDFARERADEIADMLVYSSMAELKRTLGGG